MGHLCWGRNAMKESRWGYVNRSITILHVWVDKVSKYGDEVKVGEVVESFVSDRDRVCWLATVTYDSDGCHEVVSPFFDDVE